MKNEIDFILHGWNRILYEIRQQQYGEKRFRCELCVVGMVMKKRKRFIRTRTKRIPKKVLRMKENLEKHTNKEQEEATEKHTKNCACERS